MLAKKILKKEAAFTLIELLVVIVIISILAVFLFVAFTQVQKGARDQQRNSDLQSVAGALQRFYSDNSQYPQSSSGLISYFATNCTSTGAVTNPDWGTDGISCTPTGSASAQSYIKQLPKDPSATNEYCYTAASPFQTYNLYGRMEGNGNITATTPAGCTGTNYNFRITPQD